MTARGMNADEKLHADRLAQMGCLVCKVTMNVITPAIIHHVRRGWQARNHERVAPLCPHHHITPTGIHGPSGRQRTDDLLGFSIEKWAAEQWQISQKEKS